MEITRQCSLPDGIIPNVVALGVNDESHLFKSAKKLDSAGIRYSLFIEPDMNNEVTALASEPVSGNNRLVFKNYQLLKGGTK